jgi:hypothetical protein
MKNQDSAEKDKHNILPFFVVVITVLSKEEPSIVEHKETYY